MVLACVADITDGYEVEAEQCRKTDKVSVTVSAESGGSVTFVMTPRQADTFGDEVLQKLFALYSRTE